MKIAIMQPYFLPYIGYFQLMQSVDTFVIYDDIEFTKKGWINRNRFLIDSKDFLFSLPLKNDSDYFDIKDRKLAENYNTEAVKILKRIESAYKKAPYFKDVFPLIENCFQYENPNLFNFIHNSLKIIKLYLKIDTECLVSSQININRLKGTERVLSICKALKADHYINAIGGVELYDKDVFRKEGIELSFIKTGNICYQQFSNEFVPNLSIIDVLMFNSPTKVKKILSNYTLI